jgi:hypothetical protein
LSLEANLHLASALPSVLPDPETSFSSGQEHDERQSFCSSVRAEATERPKRSEGSEERIDGFHARARTALLFEGLSMKPNLCVCVHPKAFVYGMERGGSGGAPPPQVFKILKKTTTTET